MFSADTHAFASSSAPHLSRAAYYKAEGDGFPGTTILVFSAIALVWGLRRLVVTTPWATMRDWQFLAVVVSGTTAALSAAVVLWLFIEGRVTLDISGRILVLTSVRPALDITFAFAAVCLLVLAVVGRRAAGPTSDAFGFFLAAAIGAALLALGPQIEVAGRRVGPGPYAWLLTSLPGFDGLRVPARMLMLVSLFLSVIVGLGAAAILRTRAARAATIVIGLAGAGVVYEGWMAPMPMNVPVTPGPGITRPPPPAVGRHVSPVYATLRTLPDPVVLVEFPFGDPAWEPIATLYAGYHRRPLLNGYSGFAPPSYTSRLPVLRHAPDDPERLAAALAQAGITHVLVHEGAFLDDRGLRLSAWLRSRNARELATAGTDRLFAID